MTKKYRLKKGHDPVDLLCVSDKAHYPVVYQYPYNDTWFVSVTSALGTDACTIEEVPEVNVEVGDVIATINGPIIRVITDIHDGTAYYTMLLSTGTNNSALLTDVKSWISSGGWKKVGKIVYDN